MNTKEELEEIAEKALAFVEEHEECPNSGEAIVAHGAFNLCPSETCTFCDLWRAVEGFES